MTLGQPKQPTQRQPQYPQLLSQSYPSPSLLYYATQRQWSLACSVARTRSSEREAEREGENERACSCGRPKQKAFHSSKIIRRVSVFVSVCVSVSVSLRFAAQNSSTACAIFRLFYKDMTILERTASIPPANIKLDETFCCCFSFYNTYYACYFCFYFYFSSLSSQFSVLSSQLLQLP